MICWQCRGILNLVYQAEDLSNKLYHCQACDRWYEMRKDKVKVNSSVSMKFVELEIPQRIIKRKTHLH